MVANTEEHVVYAHSDENGNLTIYDGQKGVRLNPNLLKRTLSPSVYEFIW
jgi:hypothetical protein